jgi:hypothetical protein
VKFFIKIRNVNMYLSRVTALLVLLLSNAAMAAEPNLGALLDIVGKVIESQAKNNQQQGSVDNTNSSPQSTTADAGQSAEDIKNSGPLTLAPPSRSLERTLKLAPVDASKYTSASFFCYTYRQACGVGEQQRCEAWLI